MTALLDEARDMADFGRAYTPVEPEGKFRHLTVGRSEHYRTCADCQGTGSVTVNRSHNGDPQCDEDAMCPNPDCLDGYITVWRDPLLRLHDMRDLLLRCRRSATVNMIYGEVRQEAVSAATLPDVPARFRLERAA